MAKLEILAPFILSFEGGYVNLKNDRGGATNKGVTIATWRKVGYDKDGDGDIDVDDLKLISDTDAIERVMRPHYWNKFKADSIKDQSIANTLVDWLWGSGYKAITITQQLLGVKADGIVGNITLNAINSADARTLFNCIQTRRKQFINNIVKNDSTQSQFLSGWLRRLSYIQYGSLRYNAKNKDVHYF